MLNDSGNFVPVKKEEIVFGLVYYYKDFASKQYEPIIFFEKNNTEYSFYDILKNQINWVRAW